jgi:hypothetical protein
MKPCYYLSLACLICLLNGCTYTIAPPQQPNTNPGNYERWMKSLVERYPVALGRDEKVFDWWPLENGLEYKCKITGSVSDSGQKWINKEFTMKLVKEKEHENSFHFEVEGFSEFPYEGLLVRANRVFVVKAGAQSPLVVFPLFENMVFSTEAYEHEFLKRSVLATSEQSFFAPVWTGFYRVKQVVPDTYSIEQLQPKEGLSYKFQKGVGIVEWFVPGGYTIELSNSRPLP